MEYRIEHDSLGEVKVAKDVLWGAQTQRSLENFEISSEKMPLELIKSFAVIKKAAAITNYHFKKLSKEKCDVIATVCDEILKGQHNDAFPLVIWQTGSGTQTNMNVNEVIARRGNLIAKKELLHPNDDVNMSQSSNDTFPTAMHLASLVAIKHKLIPEIENIIIVLENHEHNYQDLIKIGRTHLQDATPLTFAQEVSAWKEMLKQTKQMIQDSSCYLYPLALGGTAVGTGINAPEGFGEQVAQEISKLVGEPFTSATNKFHSLSSKDAFVFVHGSLKALAANLMKIANDIRLLASGPRCGIGEITIPANEPGSSIMPGKINPTQCEAMTMIAVQVMANDCAITTAASQGNFQLNVFMPVMIHNMMQSIRLLSDGIHSFNKNCVMGIGANTDQMTNNLHNSLMLVTCLSPTIGYEKAAKVAKYAHEQELTLKEACEALEILAGDDYDAICQPEKMI